ncbi:MAG: hypothetical protein M3Q06_03970 [Bacteroidota bacterium]|nr:hypothetical protein [Bacteroidota bacterium]
MEKEKNPQSENNHQDDAFVSDAKKLADKHMADPNHVITDEELQNIRVGVTPSLPDEPTQQAIAEAEDRTGDRKTPDEDKTLPGAQKMTPWDVVE